METLYVLQQLLLICLLPAAAWVVAKAILGDSLRLPALEESALLIPAGLGVFILLLFVLGIVHLLYLPVVLLVFGGCLVAALISLQKRSLLPDIRRLIQGWSVPGLGLALLGLILIVPIVLAPLRPPVDSDEIRFHLPYAMHFAEQHAITPHLYLRYPFHALNIDLLYSFGILAGDDVTTHFLHMALGLLLAWCLFVLAARHTNIVIAWCAVFLFLSIPGIQRLTSTAYVDLGLACFGFAAMAGISFAGKHNVRAVLLTAALLTGIAAGSKYLGLVFIPLFAAWAYYFSRNMRETGIFFLTALLVASPWYVYNLIHAGNPVSPFAGELFGYWPWSEADAADQMRELVSHGTGYSLQALLSLPLTLFTVPGAYQEWGGLPWMLALLFPALLYLPFWKDSLKPFGVLFIIALLGWFYGAQVLRYFITFLPLWSLFAVWGFTRGLGYFINLGAALPGLARLKQGERVGRITGIVAVVIVCTFYTGRAEDFRVFPAQMPELVSQREAYLADRFPEYLAVEYINDSYTGEIILQYEAWAALSYVRHNLVVGDYFGLYRYPDIRKAFESGSDAGMAALRGSGATLLLVPRNIGRLWIESFRGLMPVEYEDDNAVIFRVQDRQAGVPRT